MVVIAENINVKGSKINCRVNSLIHNSCRNGHAYLQPYNKIQMNILRAFLKNKTSSYTISFHFLFRNKYCLPTINRHTLAITAIISQTIEVVSSFHGFLQLQLHIPAGSEIRMIPLCPGTHLIRYQNFQHPSTCALRYNRNHLHRVKLTYC